MRKVLLLLALFALSNCSVTQDPVDSQNPANTGGKSIMEYGLGVLPQDQAYLDTKLITKQPGFAAPQRAVPASVDLSAQLPPVGNQGSQNCCTAWSTTYYTKTHGEGLEMKWNLNLQSAQFSPSWVYNQVNGGQNQGIYISTALEFIVKNGADTLDQFSYNQNDWTRQPDAASKARASQYKSGSWFTLPKDVATIKNYLAAGSVLVFEVPVYDDLVNLSPSNPVYDNFSGNLLGYHAMTLVGYDDTKSAFKFVNSWGSGWGNWKYESDQTKGKGFGWLTYNVVNNGVYFNTYILINAANVFSSSSASSIKSSSSSITSSSSSSAPRQNIPAKIEAESYTAMSGIQTETCSEGTLNIGWIDTGDWFEYAVTAASSGSYKIEYRVANQFDTGKIDFVLDGTTVTTTSVPNTGAWQTWTTVSTTVTIGAGNHTIRLFASGSPWNLNFLSITAVTAISSSKSSISSSSSKSSIISSSSVSSVNSSSSSIVVSSSSKSSSTSTAVGGLKIQFFNGSTAVSGNQIYGRFNVINTSSSAIALSSVKIRYYYTLDGSQAQNFWCDWSPAGSANITGTFGVVSPAKTGADTYLEVGFTSAAGSLAPGASVDVQTRIAKADWSNYSQSNDYSFNSTATSYADWNKVAAFVSGTQVWGILP